MWQMQQMHGIITATSKTIDTTNVKDTTAETTDTAKIIKDAMTKITDTTKIIKDATVETIDTTIMKDTIAKTANIANMIKDAIAERLIQQIINKRCHDKTTIAISSK